MQVGARGATFYLARAEEGERGRKREEGGNGGEIVFDSISRALGMVASPPLLLPARSLFKKRARRIVKGNPSSGPFIWPRRNAKPDSLGQIWPLAGKLPLRRRFRYVRRVSQSQESRLTISALFHFVAPGRRYNRGPTDERAPHKFALQKKLPPPSLPLSPSFPSP